MDIPNTDQIKKVVGETDVKEEIKAITFEKGLDAFNGEISERFIDPSGYSLKSIADEMYGCDREKMAKLIAKSFGLNEKQVEILPGIFSTISCLDNYNKSLKEIFDTFNLPIPYRIVEGIIESPPSCGGGECNLACSLNNSNKSLSEIIDLISELTGIKKDKTEITPSDLMGDCDTFISKFKEKFPSKVEK